MAKYVIEDTTLTGIADAIRAKTGSTDPIPVADMAAQIAAMTGDGGSAEGIAYVTFMNGDAELCKTACMTGDSTVDPVEDGKIAVPTKEPAVDTVYTYAGGWALTDGGEADEMALVDVTEDRVVYAVYEENVRKYTVNFYDGENLLESLQVPYGQVPSPAVPTKDGFFFDGWSPALAAVAGDADYQAVWSESNVLDSGTCGDTTYWELTKAGVLTISGTGAMADYGYGDNPPWYGYKDAIVSVVVLEGITYCGQRMCAGHTNLASVTLPEGLLTVGPQAFQTTGLTSVMLPETLTKVDMYAFGTAGITEAYVPENLTHMGPGAFGDYSSTLGGQSLSSASFEVTEGWRVSNQGFTQAASGISVSADTLADPASAATLMNSTYLYYYWVRT